MRIYREELHCLRKVIRQVGQAETYIHTHTRKGWQYNVALLA
jgi:DNA-binding winged helix-turn-helix (wHTH) protein